MSDVNHLPVVAREQAVEIRPVALSDDVISPATGGDDVGRSHDSPLGDAALLMDTEPRAAGDAPPPVVSFKLPPAQRALLASHFAQTLKESRRGGATDRPLEAEFPAGSTDFLAALETACSTPTALSMPARAVQRLLLFYGEAAASAGATKRDPLRFSEAALVISACDGFLDYTRGFCRTLESSINAAAPALATKNTSSSAMGATDTGAGAPHSPQRGGDRGILGLRDAANGQSPVVGQRSDAAQSSMQANLAAMRLRLDRLTASVTGLLGHCSQLESNLRSAADFRKRVAEVVDRCYAAASGGDSPRTAAGTTKLEAARRSAAVASSKASLVRAVLKETASDVEYRTAQRFVQFARAEIPQALSRYGFVDGASLTLPQVEPAFNDMLDAFYRRWLMLWGAERQELQNWVTQASDVALAALRGVHAVWQGDQSGDAFAAVPGDTRPSPGSWSGSVDVEVAALEAAPALALPMLALPSAGELSALTSTDAVAGRLLMYGQSAAATLPPRPVSRAQTPTPTSGRLAAVRTLHRARQANALLSSALQSRDEFSNADAAVEMLRKVRPMVPSSSPIDPTAPRAQGATQLTTIEALQRHMRSSGVHRGAAASVGAAATIAPVVFRPNGHRAQLFR
jgi:hypothetical protein